MARAVASASSQWFENTNAPVTAAPLSVAGWCKRASGDVSWCFVLVDYSAVFSYFYIAGTDTYIQAGCRIDSGTSGPADTTAAPPADTWFHFAGVWISSTSRAAYLNGGNKGTSSVNVTPTGIDRVQFGARSRNGGASTDYGDFDGLGEIGLWNAALTDAEVAVLAKGVSPLMVRPQSLVAYWPLLGNQSPEIDLVGGYDMTLNAAPTKAAHPRVIYPAPPTIHHAPTAGIAALNVNISKSADYIQVVTP